MEKEKKSIPFLSTPLHPLTPTVIFSEHSGNLLQNRMDSSKKKDSNGRDSSKKKDSNGWDSSKKKDSNGRDSSKKKDSNGRDSSSKGKDSNGWDNSKRKVSNGNLGTCVSDSRDAPHPPTPHPTHLPSPSASSGKSSNV